MVILLLLFKNDVKMQRGLGSHTQNRGFPLSCAGTAPAEVSLPEQTSVLWVEAVKSPA